MGFGILEPKQDVVQGTVQLFDDASIDSTDRHTTVHLKHSPDGKVVLAPQPSDDPDDPLNWPQWRRDASYVVILVTAILSLIHGPMLSPVTVELATKYGVSINAIAQLSSYMTLMVAIFSYVDSALARSFGKRGLFVVSGLLLVVADSWAACASSYNSLLGARILSGAGQAMFEGNGLSIVPDLFFLHERGKRVAIFLFCSQTGVTLGTPLATRIATKYGMRWCFGGLAIAEAIMTLAIFFLFAECAYAREHVDALAHQDEQEIIKHVHEEAVKTEHVDTVKSSGASPKKTYLRQLSLYSSRVSQLKPFSLIWRTFALTFHPTIFWVAISGLTLSWPVGIAFTSAALLLPPPYNFSATGAGNIWIAPWIGAMFGMILGGTNDYFVKWMTKRNRNVYEPEFRLYYMFPGIILYLIGYIGWGWGAQDQISWPGLVVFFGFTYCGSLIVNIAGIAYLLDAHRMYAVESQVVLFAIKNFFPFAMGYFFVAWYDSAGPKMVFGISGAIQAGITLFAIPFYIYGKKLRAYWMRHPYLGIRDMHGDDQTVAH